MSKKYDITKDYKPCGNRTIDTVASMIIWHRNRKIALKTIYVKQPYYDRFMEGLEKLMGRKLEDGELMSFDAVNIEKASFLQVTPFSAERFDDFNHNIGYVN